MRRLKREIKVGPMNDDLHLLEIRISYRPDQWEKIREALAQILAATKEYREDATISSEELRGALKGDR